MRLLLALGAILLFAVSCGESGTTANDTNETNDQTQPADQTAVTDTDTAQTPDTAADTAVQKDDAATDSEVPEQDSLISDEDVVSDCKPGEFPNTCGTWAQKMFFTATSKVLSIPAATATTETLFLIKHRQDGAKIWADSKICHIEIKNNTGMLEIKMPPSFANGLKLLHKEATLKKENGKVTYFQDTYWELRSVTQPAQGEDPAKYVLPTAETDPRAEDWDNDGTKGLLVVIGGTMSGNTHIVEKSSSKLNGEVTGEGQNMVIGGAVYWTDEQVVLKTDNIGLKKGAENYIKESERNDWKQVRVDDNWTCDDIIKNGATLFPE